MRPLLAWLTTQYVFTNRRIITRTGILSRSGKDMPLSKLNDVSLRVHGVRADPQLRHPDGVVGRRDGALVIRNVPRVEEIQREIYRLAEADAERGGTVAVATELGRLRGPQ